MGIFILSYSPSVRKGEIGWLSQKAAVSQTPGDRTQKFLFYNSPRATHSKIGWSEEKTHCTKRSLKLSFSGSDVHETIGIRLNASVVLRPYLNDGALEFWVKGGANYSPLTRLDIYLKDWPAYIGTASVSYPISLTDDWRKVFLPLSSFKINERHDPEREDFTWYIKEISFGVNSFATFECAEVYIDCLRVTQNGQIISELL